MHLYAKTHMHVYPCSHTNAHTLSFGLKGRLIGRPISVHIQWIINMLSPSNDAVHVTLFCIRESWPNLAQQSSFENAKTQWYGEKNITSLVGDLCLSLPNKDFVWLLVNVLNVHSHQPVEVTNARVSNGNKWRCPLAYGFSIVTWSWLFWPKKMCQATAVLVAILLKVSAFAYSGWVTKTITVRTSWFLLTITKIFY